ncbi:MAG: hypothetical protein E3J94_07285 [Desulfobacteraceae bacterium]|nr:MAG: hypothetical protein E3J94_07285 [Desulfobacteraceae bacterium]
MEIKAEKPGTIEIKADHKSNADLLKLAQERYTSAVEAHETNRNNSIEDLEFIEGGHQWPEELSGPRDIAGQPCLEINKLPGYLDQLVGEQRQNRPAIKVVPFDSESDPETAEIFTGLIRNIEYVSMARVAYDHAFEHAAACGEGFFQILTEYAEDDIFEQNIIVKPILNSSTVHWDPSAEDVTLKDADWFFVETKIKRHDFEKKHPNSALVGWNDTEDYDVEWVTKDEIKVAAYWLKVPIEKMIYQVLNNDGSTKIVEKLEEGQESVKERLVKTHKVVRYLITSHDVLEGPSDFASKYIPIVPVWGKELNVNGRRVLRGIVRHAKDPQRIYNYSRSHGVEITSLQPKSPFLATPKQLEGHEKQWNRANKENYVYLYYNPDPEAADTKPTRQPPPQASSAIQQEIIIADQEIDDTTGLYEASRGQRSNEKSGKAILARQAKGSIANFAYMDNLARSKIHAGKIYIDLIQNVYDTERIVRIMNEDETTQHITINSYDEKESKPLNDITIGKYDAIVTIGPSYVTQREEASDSMMAFITAYPAAAPIIGDLIAKNQNWQGADKIAERLKKLLPPGIADEEDKDKSTPGSGPAQPGQPPPGQAAPPAPEQIQAGIEIKILQVKLEQEKADLKKKQVQVQVEQKKLSMEGGGF